MAPPSGAFDILQATYPPSRKTLEFPPLVPLLPAPLVALLVKPAPVEPDALEAELEPPELESPPEVSPAEPVEAPEAPPAAVTDRRLTFDCAQPAAIAAETSESLNPNRAARINALPGSTELDTISERASQGQRPAGAFRRSRLRLARATR